MENIEKILEFLKIEPINNGFGYGSCDGDGYGDGFGYGYGSGSCFGYGSGSCFGDGYGDGDGSGSGSGDGSGFGDGYGSGFGSGDGDGDGDGSGFGLKIKQIKDELVFYVDKVPTIFEHIHGNVAKCKIINESDFTVKNCYVVKNEDYFAHGETIKKAISDLQEKIFDNMDIDSKIEEFRKFFNNKDKYAGEEFYNWHHILTGSCEMGRKNFFKQGNYKMTDMFTVKEFIKITKNAYGGEIIKRLKEYYK